VWALSSGYVTSVNTRGVGMAVVALGGGRQHPGAAVDLAVGFSELSLLGDFVDDQRPLGWVHAATAPQAQQAADALRAAYCLGRTPLAPAALIHQTLV
jgi:thymidine phosphorylase